MKPLVEEIEDREQLLLWLRGAPFGLGLDPIHGPASLALLEEGEHEVVLGGEMPIQRRLRDAGAFNDLIDSDSANSAGRKHAVSGIEQTFASGPAGGGPAGAWSDVALGACSDMLLTIRLDRQVCLG